MKALILNSGTGSRLGRLTDNSCKCLASIADGVTIFDLQIDALLKCGVNDICITTGAHSENLIGYACEKYPGVNFTFVYNPIYDKSNYIYSIYLAGKLLDGDILMMHGDLLFEFSVLQDALSSPESVMIVDTTKSLPQKDFKAVVEEGKIRYVGVDICADALADAVYAQPLYKLLWKDWEVWLREICRFCEDGNTGVYAEEALNGVSSRMYLFPMDILGRDCFEVDNLTDLEKARKWYLWASDRGVI